MPRLTHISPLIHVLSATLWLGLGAAGAWGGPGEGSALQTNAPQTAPSPEEVDAEGAEPPSEGTPAVSERDPARVLPPRTTQSASDGGSSGRSFVSLPEGAWRTVGSLGLVIGLMFGLRSVMTRFGGPLAKARAPSGIIEVLGRFPLTRGQTLLLIRLDRRVLLLAQTSQGLTTLAEVSDAEQVASLVQRIRNDRGDSFTKQFERLVTPVAGAKDAAGIAPTVIDLTRPNKSSAARRVASMLGDGVRA